MDNKRVKRLLIIKPSSLGDVIHALPVAASLKAALPGVRVDWVVSGAYAELLSGNPAIDRLITFDRDMLGGGGRFGRLAGFLRELRRERYDAVLDLQGLLRSALMALACRSGRRLGLSDAREGAALFYHERVSVPGGPMHAVERYMLALPMLGVPSSGETGFTIAVSDADTAEADGILRDLGVEDGERFIAIAPGGRWQSKRWPAENFVSLANRLKKEKGLKSVFVGTAEDGERFSHALGRLDDKNSFAFGRTTLKGLAALLKRASILITNDSGPMHVAAAVGTPVAAIFGPTDPRRTGPYGKNNRVITAGFKCAPCFRKECRGVRCMAAVSVDDVYKEVICP